jgi:cystathionine beta-lyase
MDFPVAEPIKAAIRDALANDDCGYAFPAGVAEAFGAWAKQEYGWDVEPRDLLVVADVGTGMGELIRTATSPGDGIVIDPPLYHRFAALIRELDRQLVEAPLRIDPEASKDAEAPLALDLDAIERAYASGARVHVFCSPHNPSGRVHRRHELERVAELADHHGVLILSSEVHAPMTLPGATHHPLLTISDAARRRAIVLTSASKTWNLAGLKAAMIIAQSDQTRAVVARLSPNLPYHAGVFGVLAARIAFSEAGAPWRKQLLAILDRNRALLADLLRERLPAVRYIPPEAGYLAWLDCRGLRLGDDPARQFLKRGRVAFSAGPMFGTGGAGHVRLNFGTTEAFLRETVERMVSTLS